MTPDPTDKEYAEESGARFIVSEDEGTLREMVTNSRIILFSCPAYRSMCDSLYEQFKSRSGVILFRMGQG